MPVVVSLTATPPLGLKSRKFRPLAALPSVARTMLRPSGAVSVRLFGAVEEAKTPGICAALTAATREAALVIVPVTGTPFTVSAPPARSPKFRTVKARVVFAAVACTPCWGSQH